MLRRFSNRSSALSENAAAKAVGQLRALPKSADNSASTGKAGFVWPRKVQMVAEVRKTHTPDEPPTRKISREQPANELL